MNVRKAFNKFFYISPKGKVDPDIAWKQQQEQEKNNEIYKLVNFTGGGKFIEVFNEQSGSDDEKIKHFQQYFENEIKPHYLYEESTLITQAEYQDWHNKNTLRIQTLMKHKENDKNLAHFEDDQRSYFSDASLATLVFPYVDHSMRWRIDKRGAVGETPLHLLFLINTPKHIKIAKAILEVYPDLAIDLYEGFEYYGESSLHLAIIQQNVEAVKILLNTGEHERYCHSRARGHFFQPVDVKRGDVKLRKHKFEGYAYYGEFPLSFAASSGNVEIYDLLIDSNCDPARTDRFGNNVLHLSVVHNQPDMFYHAVNHSVRKADPKLANFEGLTPLALAAKLGRKEMFEKILHASSREYWSFNTVTCSMYPLKSLDTIGPKGETDSNSALMKIIKGNKQGHYDLVSNHVINQLLLKKWESFAKAKFLRLLFGYILHIAFLFPAVYLRPNVQSDLRYGTSGTDIARYVFEILVVLESMAVWFYMVREIFLESFWGFLQNLKSIPSRVGYILACFLLILCVPFRFAELYNVEDWLLVFAVPGLWFYFLFFLRSTALFGPLIIMIYKMTSDIFRFVYIYLIILLTSTLAFFYQFQGQNVNAFFTVPGSAMTLFQMSFGEFSYKDVMRAKYPLLSIILFVVFMAIVHILLLNMLIAMMTRTFEKITIKSEQVWQQQWAAMVVAMERSHRIAEKQKFQNSYDMNINTARVSSEGAAPGEEEINKEIKFDDRALMVIRHQRTSETGRRRKIQRRWQVAGEKHSFSKTKAAVSQPMLQIHSIAGMTDFMSNPNYVQEYTELDGENNEHGLGVMQEYLQESFSRRNSDAQNISRRVAAQNNNDIV